MNRYFWSFFASSWVILVLAVVLTVFFGARFADTSSGANALVSRHLTATETAIGRLVEGGAEPATLITAIANHEQVVPNLTLYLVDEKGIDVRGEPLPLPVRRRVATETRVLAQEIPWNDPRVLLNADLTEGYKLIAYESGLQPYLRALDERGERVALLVFLIFVSVVASYIAAVFTSRRLRRLKPVYATGRAAAAGDLTVRVGSKVSGTDEVAQLAQDLDALIEIAEEKKGDD